MANPDVLNNHKQRRHHKHDPKILRPYAVSIFRLKNSIKQLMDNLGLELNVDVYASICCPKDEHQFNQLPFDIINDKQPTSWYIAPLSIGIVHSYTLYHGTIENVKRNYQYYDKLTVIETLGIYNYQTISKRHVLYVKIMDAHVSQRRKRAACNVMVKLCLKHNDSYSIKQDCIMFGRSGMAKLSAEEESVVFYHTNDPNIHQLFTILLPQNRFEIENYHLYFSCFHRFTSNKKPQERGFGFIKLRDIMKSNGFTQYIVPLYVLNRNCSLGKYLESDIFNTCKSEGKYISVETCLVSNIKQYVQLLVSGYIKHIKQKLKQVVPQELLSLIAMFVNLGC